MKLIPVARNTLVQSVVDQLVGLIKDGTLAPGERLPSERELMKRLAVGRSTIREALRSLPMMNCPSRTLNRSICAFAGSSSSTTYTPRVNTRSSSGGCALSSRRRYVMGTAGAPMTGRPFSSVTPIGGVTMTVTGSRSNGTS